MKAICLCIKIHVPVVFRTFRFHDINKNDLYYDDLGSDYLLNKICSWNFYPLFKTIRSIFKESDGRFKVAISISGITLQLLHNAVPQAIDMLSELAEDGCIEFLSEPWSHSITAFSRSEVLFSQVNKHDELLISIFGRKPKVLIIHSPICPERVWRTVQKKTGQGVFIYSNHIKPANLNAFNSVNIPCYSNEGVHPVHRKISQLFQNLDFDPNVQSLNNFTSNIFRKMKNHEGFGDIMVLVYNPSDINRPFNKDIALIWKATINKLLTDKECKFCLPSETRKAMNPIVSNNKMSEKETFHFNLPANVWLKNELQKKAYTELLSIQTKMQICSNESLLRDWDFIQDMDHLYYMNDNFFSEDYCNTNYSPYASPYFAFTNYMNILEDLSGRIGIPEKSLGE